MDVTQSDTLGAAIGYALEHLPDIAARVRAQHDTGRDTRDSGATGETQRDSARRQQQ